MATYNIEITSKAIKSFKNLDLALFNSHRSFDPTVNLSKFKTIAHYHHNNYGNWLSVGGVRSHMSYRYIRIIIDIPAGSKSNEQKQELMQRTMQCCLEYEGKEGKDCEIEIRVNEIHSCDVLKTNAAGHQ